MDQPPDHPPFHPFTDEDRMNNEAKRVELVEKHGLVDDTGQWGELIDSGLDGGDVVVRNPVQSRGDARLSRAEKQAAAMRMKAKGATYPQIAEAMGYATVKAARDLVSKGIKEELHESAEGLRGIHYNRLEKLLAVHWDRALQGDNSALANTLSVMDRIERLYGLAGAKKVDHTHSTKETLIIAEGDSGAYLQALKGAAAQRDADVLDVKEVGQADPEG